MTKTFFWLLLASWLAGPIKFSLSCFLPMLPKTDPKSPVSADQASLSSKVGSGYPRAELGFEWSGRTRLGSAWLIQLLSCDCLYNPAWGLCILKIESKIQQEKLSNFISLWGEDVVL